MPQGQALLWICRVSQDAQGQGNHIPRAAFVPKFIVLAVPLLIIAHNFFKKHNSGF